MISLTPPRLLLATALALAALLGLALLHVLPVEAAPAPTISSIAPSLGPSAGGTTITLTGTGFVAGASVTVGGVAATSVTVLSGSSLTAVTPAGVPGAALVLVTNTDTQSATLGGGFTYQYPPPTATLIAPATGSSAGGTAVTITGTQFRAGATVTFGGTAATNVVVVNATTITATAPAHPIGAVDVVAANSDAQGATLAAAYTYTAAASPTVTSLAPASGTVAGGTSVTITGTGFVAGATVTFGGSAATAVTVVNATSITATTPARSSTGLVSVVVTNPDTQSGALAGAFTYNPLPAPTVTSLTPATGPALGGTSVTITGTGFVAGASVSIGGSTASSAVVASGTTITATTTQHAAGAATVIVTNPDGQSGSLTNGYTYSANTAPTATAITPSEGTTSGGTYLTITGTGFLSGATVLIGGVAATSVSVPSSTMITGYTPAHAAGSAVVMVTNYDGQTVTTSTGFTYKADDAPAITTVAPNGGPLFGGTTVTITGTGFKPEPTVSFGGFAATSTTLSGTTTITAVTPFGLLPGPVTVTVTNADGQVATLDKGFTFQTAAPTVSSISPDNGPANGGTAIVITGEGFLPGATVSFGGVAATDVYVASATEIDVIAPEKSEPGAVDVIVNNPNSAPATLASGYTYRAAGTPTVATQPPVGGYVIVVSNSTDMQALLKAQKFTVSAVFFLDVAKQIWKVYIPGAPAVVNTLTSIKATDIVILRR